MKFLIAGFGSIGRRHFRNLLSLGVDDIVFLRSNQSTIPDDEIADFKVETDMKSALSHQPDAVIITNPTSLHIDVAIQAAQQGCHLFIEKPISHSMERVDLLQEALQQGGSKVFTAFQFRFHPGLLTIKKLINNPSSVIGRPMYLRSHWGEYLPGWHPWEDYRKGYSARTDLGGGVVLTLCHPLDYVRWIFGEVASLWAFTSDQSDFEIDVEDAAEIGLRFENGVIGSIHLDFVQRPPVHRLEIIGSEGTIRWNNDNGAVWLYSANGIVETYPPPPNFERNDLFYAEMSHFIDVVQGDADPLCTLDDGIWALRLAIAVHDSARNESIIHFGMK